MSRSRVTLRTSRLESFGPRSAETGSLASKLGRSSEEEKHRILRKLSLRRTPRLRMTQPREIQVECPDCLRRFFGPAGAPPIVPDHAVEGDVSQGRESPASLFVEGEPAEANSDIRKRRSDPDPWRCRSITPSMVYTPDDYVSFGLCCMWELYKRSV